MKQNGPNFLEVVIKTGTLDKFYKAKFFKRIVRKNLKLTNNLRCIILYF